MGYPDWRAGQKIKASLLRAMTPTLVLQGTDLERTSSTTLTATNLVIPVEANALYEYRLLVTYAAGDGDVQVEWTTPAGTEMQRHGVGLGDASTGAPTNGNSLFSAQGTGATDFDIGGSTLSATANCSFIELGHITTGSTSGNVTFMFAQDISNATASILRSVSSVLYRRIG